MRFPRILNSEPLGRRRTDRRRSARQAGDFGGADISGESAAQGLARALQALDLRIRQGGVWWPV